jgi:L-lactate dehydrogenase complex protein LldG
MSANREKFLNNINTSLRHSLLPEATPEHPGSFRGYDFQAGAPAGRLVEGFTRELETLAGHVYALDDIEEIVQKILDILESHQPKQIMAWDDAALGLPGLREALIEAGIIIVDDELSANGPERKVQLAAMDGVPVGLTGAQGGLADTGAVVLISGSGRGRLASLLPPVHIALLPQSRLYPSLPAFLAANPTATSDGSNLVLIAGPSRTGDIEMTLSMGVHGPGEVHVIITP